MGFVLTVLYLVLYYLPPAYLFGSVTDLHLELILAVLIVLVSLPSMARSFVLKTPQSLALVGLTFAGFFSVLFGMHWAGGAVQAFLNFVPSISAFFFICLHCNTKRKLQVLILILISVCLFVITDGLVELQHIHKQNEWPLIQSGDQYHQEAARQAAREMETSLLQATENGTGVWFYRLRGPGVINDPNDFGQLVVCLVPLTFIFWRPKKTFMNIVCVVLPVCGLLTGLYLTHSRGTLTALIAVAIVAARRRIGTVPAVVLAAGLFAAAMALHFTGGRDISAAAGEDRTSLWGQGIDALKTHPLFGVGLNNLPEYTEEHLTAHNSVLVCAAELGMFGLYFWSMFLFPTIRDALAVASPTAVSKGHPIVVEESPFPTSEVKVEEIDKAEINRLGRLMLFSLTGFLVAGLFLSRAFVVTLFMLGGMAEVVYEMALRRQMIAPRLKIARVLRYSGGLAVTLLFVMYILVRILNLMH